MNSSLFAPFRYRLFLAIWVSTLVSNFGMQIHIMAAGWLMLRLDPSPQMVALVQVAASAPYIFFALLAGALSDVYDKRKIMLSAQLFSLGAAAVLTVLTFKQLINPWSLLFLVTMIAIGSSFFAPAWAASVSTMVPRKHLAEAISLNAINFNLGRSLAPALGGLLITLFSIAWAFLLSALSYLGVLAVLRHWKPESQVLQEDPEPIPWAISMGLRYVLRTDHIRVVVIRTILCSLGAGVFWSLMPLLANQHLGGDAGTFSILLTSLGAGALIGGLLVSKIRQTIGIQKSSTISQLVLAISGAMVVLTDDIGLCAASVAIFGSAWMVFTPNMNASIQLSAPEWIAGRLLAIFQTTVYLSFAVGGLLWGWLAAELGLSAAFLLAALVSLLSCVYGVLRPMLGLHEVNSENANLPNISDDLKRTDTGKLPIVVTAYYWIDPSDMNLFIDTMAQLRPVRLRLGATNWTLQQELENPERWIERYITKDWEELQRRPGRYSLDDNAIRLKAIAFDVRGEPSYSYMVIRNPENSG